MEKVPSHSGQSNQLKYGKSFPSHNGQPNQLKYGRSCFIWRLMRQVLETGFKLSNKNCLYYHKIIKDKPIWKSQTITRLYGINMCISNSIKDMPILWIKFGFLQITNPQTNRSPFNVWPHINDNQEMHEKKFKHLHVDRCRQGLTKTKINNRPT